MCVCMARYGDNVQCGVAFEWTLWSPQGAATQVVNGGGWTQCFRSKDCLHHAARTAGTVMEPTNLPMGKRCLSIGLSEQPPFRPLHAPQGAADPCHSMPPAGEISASVCGAIAAIRRTVRLLPGSCGGSRIFHWPPFSRCSEVISPNRVRSRTPCRVAS